MGQGQGPVHCAAAADEPPLIACSSCHPDGHTDGRVWKSGRLAKDHALFSVAHTHPLHWSADRDEVQDFSNDPGRLMQGSASFAAIKRKDGFIRRSWMKTSRRSADLDALAIYSNSFDFRLSPYSGAGKAVPVAERQGVVRQQSCCATATADLLLG